MPTCPVFTGPTHFMRVTSVENPGGAQGGMCTPILQKYKQNIKQDRVSNVQSVKYSNRTVTTCNMRSMQSEPPFHEHIKLQYRNFVDKMKSMSL